MAKTTARTRTASKAPLSLKVTLYGTKPPVWRRLLIPGEMTLGDLHEAIQAAMGWDGGHLHAFDIAGRQYGAPDSLDEVANEERLTLNKVRNTGVSRFTYTYDFGDNWEHTVLIERPRRPPEAGRYPACIAGKRNCPPEDCGGPWGYEDLLAVLADPAHREYLERVEWVGEGFDPEAFAIEEANARLAERFALT
jgi:pRiA4b ORF-3-like protein